MVLSLVALLGVTFAFQNCSSGFKTPGGSASPDGTGGPLYSKSVSEEEFQKRSALKTTNDFNMGLVDDYWESRNNTNPTTGYVDGIVDFGFGPVISGWACQLGNFRSATVRLFFGRPDAPNYNLQIGVYEANLDSESAVSNACQSSGSRYRFRIIVTPDMMDRYGGRPIYVAASRPSGAGPYVWENQLLQNSGNFSFPGAPSIPKRNGLNGKVLSFVTFNGRCIDVQGGSTDAGAPVWQYDCNGTGAQKFRAQLSDDGSYTFQNINSGMCLDVPGASRDNFATLQQYLCNGTGAQKFFVQSSDHGSQLTNGNSGKCVDVRDWGQVNGTAIQQFDCSNNNAAQQFEIRSVE